MNAQEINNLNNQRFLLNFIMGRYLGPDVKTDIPRRSALQRMEERLPAYKLGDLCNTFVSLPHVESLYYYITRNAQPSAVLKPLYLYMFIKGNLPLPKLGSLEDERQFPSFFPLDLHEQFRYRASYKVIKGIVLIDDPDISYIKPDDLQRFRFLTGLKEVKINKEEAKAYQHKNRVAREERRQTQQTQNYTRCCRARATNYIADGSASASANHQNAPKRRRFTEPVQIRMPPQIPVPEEIQVPTRTHVGPSLMTLTPIPNVENWNSDGSIEFRGSVREGIAGPPVGLVDIGIGEDAYFFRAALPGIKRDKCQFSCEIEHDGKIHLQGLTITGEEYVYRHTRRFQMKTQRLCPPGTFRISFNLPGLVDPRLFSPDFGPDGILEAVVKKYRRGTPLHRWSSIYIL